MPKLPRTSSSVMAFTRKPRYKFSTLQKR